MKKIIGKLLILIGITIILTVIYTNYSTLKNNENLVEEYKNINVKIHNPSRIKDSQNNIEDIIGILIIPKINLEVVIKNKISNENLKESVAHFEETVMPGEIGNFAIAGHRAYTSNQFFSELDKLDIGDEVNILSNRKNYTYKIDKIQVVTPDKVEVLNPVEKDKKEITLVTCTPKFIGSHRLIIKGKLYKITSIK